MAEQEQQQEEIELNFRLDSEGRTESSEASTTSSSARMMTMDYATHTRRTKLVVVPPEAEDPSKSTTEPSSLQQQQQGILDELLLDCEVADSALMPRTFWMPATGMTPRCSLEQMALDIFRHHTRDAIQDNSPNNNNNIDWTKSGAEWWVQLRPSPQGGRYAVLAKEETEHKTNTTTKDNSPSTDLSHEGISFHWDKDEDLRLLMGGNTYIHPHISTVTYLTNKGAPTLAVNYRIHPLTGEWLDESMDPSKKQAFLSWPSTLKHLSFDGRYLHAAIPDFTEHPIGVQNSKDGGGTVTTQKNEKEDCNDNTTAVAVDSSTQQRQQRQRERRTRRATFLVNIWLHFHPINVHPFPESMLDKMSGHQSTIQQNHDDSKDGGDTPSCGMSSSPRVGLSFAADKDAVEHVPINDQTDCNTMALHQWPMGGCGSGESIRMALPTRQAMKGASHKGGNMEIHWETSTNVANGVRLEKIDLQEPPLHSSDSTQVEPDAKRARVDKSPSRLIQED